MNVIEEKYNWAYPLTPRRATTLHTVLMSIDFGVKLPDDLTTSLSNYLTSLGIDAVAFMSMLVVW